MEIRKARVEDVKALLDIYNYEVLNGVATLDIKPKTLEEWRQWFLNHQSDIHPLLVASIDGNIAGYASLSSYREKEAFKSTVEISVYIHKDYRKQKVASYLVEEILNIAYNHPHIHTIVSVITSGNDASIKMCQKYGFSYCGTIHEVGMKFGKYLDVDHYELIVKEENL